MIKINGKIIHSGGGMPIKINIDKKGVYIIEAVFLSSSLMPAVIRFCPQDAVFDSPLARVTKYSENVYMLEFINKKAAVEGFFQPVSQIQFKQKGIEHIITLYYDGFYYAQFENEHTVINKKINCEAENLSLSVINLKDNNIAAIKGGANGKIYCQLVACGEDYSFKEFYADSIEVKDGFIVIQNNLEDMAKHSRMTKLDYDGANFIIAEEKTEALLPLCKNEMLIPYYFLEAVLAEDYQQAVKLLNENNYKDITHGQLKSFFGEFTDVAQNSYESRFAKYPAVIRRRTDSFYTLSYYDFSVKDGLIENIVSVD